MLIAAGAAIVGFASVIQGSHHHHHHHHHHHYMPPPVASPVTHVPPPGPNTYQGPELLHAMGEDAGGGGAGVGRHMLGSHWLVQGFHTLRKGGSSSSSSSGGGPADGIRSSEGSGNDWLGRGGNGSGGAAAVQQGGPGVLPLVGDLLVVMAQLFAALQFVVEEKFMAKFRMQPLLAVGVEGAWGVVLSLCVLPLLGRMQVRGRRAMRWSGCCRLCLVGMQGHGHAVFRGTGALFLGARARGF